MDKHLYCCQNAIQNFYDHIIPVQDNFSVKDACLCNMSKEDFINGFKELVAIIKSIYADMIQNPKEYGLPMVEDIEYSLFNPKAADSKNSAHRLFALLFTLARNGELKNDEIVVDDNKFKESLKKLKSIYKVANSKIIMQKLHDFGFVYENGVFSYSDNRNVIPALYGYMKVASVDYPAAHSFNYLLTVRDLPAHHAVIAEYLSGNERNFFVGMNDFMEANGFAIGDESDYRPFSFSIEYWIDSKNKKRIVRCHTDNGRLCVLLKLHNSDCYDHCTENLPENIKQIFRKESSCRACRESCSYRLFRTFEGVLYTDCGYGNWFPVAVYDSNDIEYYEQILLLEAKAEKTNARRKGIKVYNGG